MTRIPLPARAGQAADLLIALAKADPNRDLVHELLSKRGFRTNSVLAAGIAAALAQRAAGIEGAYRRASDRTAGRHADQLSAVLSEVPATTARSSHRG